MALLVRPLQQRERRQRVLRRLERYGPSPPAEGTAAPRRPLAGKDAPDADEPDALARRLGKVVVLGALGVEATALVALLEGWIEQ